MASYLAFGLIIQSEIALPLRQIAEQTPDIRIQFGTVPQKLATAKHYVPHSEFNETQCCIHIVGIADYLIENGQSITVQLQAQAGDKYLIWLLGSAMGALLHQRALTPLHASAIETDYGAVLFCGESGAGKSTLAAGFIEAGYRFIADDVSVLSELDGQIVVHPAYPHQKLCDDTFDQLAQSYDGLQKILESTNKYKLPRLGEFAPAAVPVRFIYNLQSPSSELKSQSLAGIDKLDILDKHIYRHYYSYSRTIQVQTLTRLAAQAHIAHLYVPHHYFSLHDVLAFLKADMQAKSASVIDN